MPYPFIKRYLPTREFMREHTLFRIWGHRLLEPELWHLHRRSVGGAVFIGLFCAFFTDPYTNARGRIDGADRPMQHRAFGRRHMGYQPVNHGTYVFLRL